MQLLLLLLYNKLTLKIMKLLLKVLLAILLFSSCEKQDQKIKLKVNYFKQTINTPNGPMMTLSVQTGNDIGTTKWSSSVVKIIGFIYEPGYVYELLVSPQTIESPYVEVGKTAYVLTQILSKTKVASETSFVLDLKTDDINYVNGDTNSGFSILNEVTIDCNNLCTDLSSAMQSNLKNVKGKFFIKEDGTLKLLALTND